MTVTMVGLRWVNESWMEPLDLNEHLGYVDLVVAVADGKGDWLPLPEPAEPV